ncbi:ABC transporter permease subunit [Thermococcus waiotapuensis]|uniref:ABC transporter permease subunit n=1 Tax=Thermococcus waiotapuensis TaxID=90909 RepID=A0AAE4NU19_9EURY|nr:ABC transporter permease subunit [Thermococcus waiotapuensis]MDV3104338.1 ABC transporter permease subunit [Thermococcus waiotapuensis]
MKRFLTLLSWEISDPLRLAIFLLGVPSLTYVLEVSYLKAQWEVVSVSSTTFIPPTVPPINSVTAIHLFEYLSFSPGFWILLAFLVSVFSILAFRYDRERGYAFTVYSLPFTKGELFLAKTLSVLLASILFLYIPLLIVDLVPNADIIGVVKEITLTTRYFYLLVFATYFVLFSLSVSVTFSVLLRNMFLSFIASFFLLVLPFFADLSWPPFSFVPMLEKSLCWVSPFESGWVLRGLVVPAVLLTLSGAVFVRGDVL